MTTASEPALRAAPAGMTALLQRALLRPMARGGSRGLSILIYHRVLAEPDPLFPDEVDRAVFERHLRMLAGSCTVLPLIEAVRRLRAGTLPPRAACITFDDGYADNAEVALPMLARHGMAATFFVATGFLNGGRMWNDTVIETVRRAPGTTLDASALGLGTYALDSPAARRRALAALIGKLKYLPMAERLAQVERLVALVGVALPDQLMMSDAQVRQLHQAGMGIGAHTVNHPILATLSPEQARAEIGAGKARLEAIIGAPVPLFAYPNGKPGSDYLAEHVAIVRELGFEAAVSTAWGASAAPPDLFQLPRFTPWDRGGLRFALRLALNLGRPAQQL